ncbi:hypothetical protein MPL3365_60180 [Mesorhizobium plurifarium]|uniref:Uncharacterized protein n=1 Tax=Mesorhizobium plurifarium TaxID=69974 RepID=A0A090GBL8_MESPL|nr:hypothetical protein MPL3365_60180 [Mesorhizobium plurifarium]
MIVSQVVMPYIVMVNWGLCRMGVESGGSLGRPHKLCQRFALGAILALANTKVFS